MLKRIIEFLEVDSATIVEENEFKIVVEAEGELYTATKGHSEFLNQDYLDFGYVGVIHL
jgi:hypothetical protein